MDEALTPRRSSRTLWARVGLVAHMALLVTLSHQSSLPVDTHWFAHADKVQHALAFAVLGALAWFALPGTPLRRCVAAVALAWAFGVSDELHQVAVAGRDASVLDWLADAVGAACGVGLAIFMNHGKKMCPNPNGRGAACR